MKITVGSKFEIKHRHTSIIDRIVGIFPILEEIDNRLKRYKPIHLCWLFEKLGLPIPRYLIAESTIDVGDAAVDRDSTWDAGYTELNMGNPANASGVLTNIAVYIAGAGSFKFGVFYALGGNTFKVRSIHDAGALAAGLRNVAVNMAISAGDFIGGYVASGSIDQTGGSGTGMRYKSGDHCNVAEQDDYTLISPACFSVYATGVTIPNAPSGCTPHYVATNNTKCTWQDNSGMETNFRIEVDVNDAGFAFWKNVGAGVQDSGTYTTGANKKVRFRVLAYNTAGNSGWSTSGYIYTIPTAPSGCTAHYAAPNAYATWADNSAYEDGFRVEYSYNSGGSWELLENTAANTEQSSNLDVTGQAKVRFKVRSYIGGLYSAWSESSDIFLTPIAPNNCIASYVATDQSKCTWTDNSGNEIGFRLEVDIDDVGWVFWKDVGENVQDSGNHPTGANKKIRFRVRAYNDAGDSDWATSGYAYTIPTIPSDLVASWLVEYETARLTYIKNQAYGDIDIYLAVNGGGSAHLAYDDVSPYDDTTPGENYKYDYKIRARSPQNDDASYTYSAFTAVETLYAPITLVESIGLLESLPVIHREIPPLEEAIAFIESLPVIRRQLPPLEETLALAESFVASDQTIVRITPGTEFLAEQAKRSNTPAKRIWLYINSSLYDITDKFMSMGPIDRKMTYKPGETKLLTISDQNLVMSNADKYFSDLNPDSPFYSRVYAGSDQVKVFAGFVIPATGYAEVLQKADMKLIAIKLMTKEAHGHLRCQDSFREVFDIYVGMPDSEGGSDPLIYTNKTFKYIMDDLLINKAGIVADKVDIEDVTLTFSSISFEKKKVVDCVQKLSEVARGNTVVLGDGTVQFRCFISEVTDVDLIMKSGENYSRLRYVGQDFTLKVNKVVVIGAAGVYAEAEISGETGVTLKYENDAILTDAVAADVAAECLGRFAVRPALVEVTGEYLPSLDLKSIVKVYEPNSMMGPAIMQIRELALDIVGHSTRMLLSIPDAAGRSKTWTSKADFLDGILSNTEVPDGELQLIYPQTSGYGEYIFDMYGA